MKGRLFIALLGLEQIYREEQYLFIFIKSLLVYESIVFVLPDPVAHLLARGCLVTEDDIPCPSPGFASEFMCLKATSDSP
jgi:hypothetical protein